MNKKRIPSKLVKKHAEVEAEIDTISKPNPKPNLLADLKSLHSKLSNYVLKSQAQHSKYNDNEIKERYSFIAAVSDECEILQNLVEEAKHDND